MTNRSIEASLLPYCEREGITVIAYSPLARGDVSEARFSRAILEKYHMTPAQLMLNWVTRHEDVVAIPKSSNRKHIEENADSVLKRLSDDDCRLISHSFL